MDEEAADSRMPVSSNMVNMYTKEIKRIGMMNGLTLSVVYQLYEFWRIKSCRHLTCDHGILHEEHCFVYLGPFANDWIADEKDNATRVGRRNLQG